ncbi:MAG: hypothetical protein R6W96_09400, partial [Clostridia bacterium]
MFKKPLYIIVLFPMECKYRPSMPWRSIIIRGHGLGFTGQQISPDHLHGKLGGLLALGRAADHAAPQGAAAQIKIPHAQDRDLATAGNKPGGTLIGKHLPGLILGKITQQYQGVTAEVLDHPHQLSHGSGVEKFKAQRRKSLLLPAQQRFKE